MNQKCERRLTLEGEELLGYIFTDGIVPLIQQTPISANLIGLGDKELVFLVDWKRLKELHKLLILEFMTKKFGVSQDEIQVDIESRGFFPLQKKYIIESYDMRYFM